ncbi:MAG TPA: hypothetical protein VH186_08465 [Chloroflexia bacterium]|nr:hypothetical protein [Chloroflexia bacterium]
MATISDYRRITSTLAYSRDHFEEVHALLTPEVSTDSHNQASPDPSATLAGRWQEVLNRGSEMAGWVESHHRAQSPSVLAALEELAKYADITKPFRLSVIGQKGVGKSALVNALLGASGVQYTPSEVSGKAVSGTRIRLLSRPSSGEMHETGDGEGVPVWKVVFLTPERLWEVGSFLLRVARVEPLPQTPAELSNREAVLAALQKALATSGHKHSEMSYDRTPASIQASGAREMLGRMLAVYKSQEKLIPPGYSLGLDEAEVDGPVSSYIRQGADDLYLIVDYVERYLEPEEAGFLAGRRLELEDVLGLDDPRDSFFALEAFKEAFAVVMVFKCDRGLNTEASSILANLFSRDEEELAHFGEVADLNKALIVANQFDGIVANVSPSRNGAGPLKGIEDIRRELAKYTRQEVPVYLTSAVVAETAQRILGAAASSTGQRQAGEEEDRGSREIYATPVYGYYLQGLANLLEALERKGEPVPAYLEFALERRAEIEALLGKSGERQGQAPASGALELERARLVLELSGLPGLRQKVEEILESGSILRGRVANAEFYYSKTVSQVALAYARQMLAHRLELAEFSRPPVSLESRLFARFQHETRQSLEELEGQMRREWFEVARRYIYGPQPPEVEGIRKHFLSTIRRVVATNRQLIQLKEHISTGQLVTDAWRKVFEDINDWLALEAGRQLKALAGPVLADIERLAGTLQRELATLAAGAGALDAAFWANYRGRLEQLRQRLEQQAEALALGYFTDHRFSVYDLKIAEILHVGDAARRREEVSRALEERTLSWFNNMWQLLARVSMTGLTAFVAETRYYLLGLPANDSLLVGLELERPGSAGLSPEDSLLAILSRRYHEDAAFRQRYAQREPAPGERVALEIREWLGLVAPPLDGLAELGRALTLASAARSQAEEAAAGEGGQAGGREPGMSEDGQPFEEGKDGLAGRYAREQSQNTSVSQNEPASGNWPPVAGNASGRLNFGRGEAQANESAGERVPNSTRLSVPVESLHPYARTTRQIWEVTNPDESALSTCLHFSRVDLGSANHATDRIIIETPGKKQTRVITGQHQDFWTEAMPGRHLTVRFVADSAQPGWGFRLDAVGSGVDLGAEEAAAGQ